jgi:hypothetical protein
LRERPPGQDGIGRKTVNRSKSKTFIEKVCVRCSKPFLGRTSQKYCDVFCRDRNKDDESEFCTAFIGAIHETQVALDLMRKGWDVFRSMSPTGPVDLVIVCRTVTLRVQVRKAHKTTPGGVSYPKAGLDDDDGLFDVLALSFADGSVLYSPEPQKWHSGQYNRGNSPQYNPDETASS